MALARGKSGRTRKKEGRAGPAPGARATIYRWDLDKTYLKTDFDSFRQLVRIPFEKPEEKVEEPGVVELIRSLRELGKRGGQQIFVYFLTGSPPQIGKAIKKKLDLDGIAYDGIVFKDQLQNLVRGRFRAMREQVGFKLEELLKGRLVVSPGAREILFGDDWETDPLVYSLYADIVAGVINDGRLLALLKRLRVDENKIDTIRGLGDRIARRPEVIKRIFIHLQRRTPIDHFRLFGPRLVPTFNYFQTALCLFESGELNLETVGRVARSLLEKSGYTRQRLGNSLDDLYRRGHLGVAAYREADRYLAQSGVFSSSRPIRSPLARRIRGWVARLFVREQPAAPPARAVWRIDYDRVISLWCKEETS